MWNHRIIKRTSDGEVVYEMCEAYYNDAGNLCGITTDAISPYGDSVDGDFGLRWVLQKMLEACDKPVLDDSNLEFDDWDTNND